MVSSDTTTSQEEQSSVTEGHGNSASLWHGNVTSSGNHTNTGGVVSRTVTKWEA